MDIPTHQLEDDEQAQVDQVTAEEAGGSASALSELRRLLPQLHALPATALTFGDDGDRTIPDPSDLLGEMMGASA